jgi:hypothetical protein
MRRRIVSNRSGLRLSGETAKMRQLDSVMILSN